MPSDPLLPATLVRALTDAERERAQGRLDELQFALAHRDDQAAQRMVGALMLSFPSARVSGEDARTMLAAYVAALTDLPPWAVNEAARRWTRGRAGGVKAFPPSSAELHEAANQIVEGFKFEAAMLERMLAGVVETEPMPTLSRERRADMHVQVQRAIAKASLDQRAAAQGLDPKAVMAEIDDTKPTSTFTTPNPNL